MEVFDKQWWSEVLREVLHESPPIEFENNEYYDHILENRDKIEKTAYFFNLPIKDVEFAFNGGQEIVLSDDIWSKLENSKSYKIKTLEEAIQHALKLGINPKPYIDVIKEGKEMPLPLVLCYSQDKYYLVGGEVILSLYKALGSIPSVLQGTLHLHINEDVNKVNIDIIKEFIKFAIKELKINKLPEGLTLSYNNDDAKSRHSFGTFDPNSGKIWLYVKNRNMADILRTLAHELVHRKQDEEGKIDNSSGETGSEIENEANAQAGMLLRDFGKSHENIYENKDYGEYLFGDKESGVAIGWYSSEQEEDTPAEKALFDTLKKYADSEESTYGNINLDSYLNIFKILKKNYPEIADSNLGEDVYIYRGTILNEEQLDKLKKEPNVETYRQGIVIPDQMYYSRRKVSSWSVNYYNAAAFSISKAERENKIPVVMRAKAGDAELFFNPKFMDKLSTQLEEEVFNTTNPIKVDIMVVEGYEDEFENIESGYLHTK